MSEADLFGESGGEGKAGEPNGEEKTTEDLDLLKSETPKEDPVQNGISTEENGVENEVDDVNEDNEDKVKDGEDEDDEEDRANMHVASPRDDIALTVVQYQKAADDYSFEVLVRGRGREVSSNVVGGAERLYQPADGSLYFRACFFCSHLYR